MRRLLKFFLYLALLLVAVLVLGLGYVYFASSRLLAKTYAVTPPAVGVPRGDPAAIEHGRYLANKVSMCTECHGEDLGGKVFMDAMPVMARLWGTNLTTGRGGVGAAYTDEDFVRVLTHGVKKDGRAALFMPSQDYHFSEADLAGLIAYIRSVPPVDRETPAPAVGPMARILTLAGAFPLLPAEMIRHDAVTLAPPPDRSTPVKSGEYLISTGACRGCHGPNLTGEGGMPDAANLTPVGLAGWSAADFKRALREGKRPNGSDIKPEMPRVFGTMSDDDLESLFAYLQSLPAAGKKSKYQ